MTSDDLTPQQVERLKRIVGRDLRFFNRLCARMQQLQFPLDDAMWLAGITARNALQDLFAAVHRAEEQAGRRRGDVTAPAQRPPRGSPPEPSG